MYGFVADSSAFELFCREHFLDFAETCFNEFGDRVKHWVTLNEPLRFAFFGNGIGIHAPGRTSNRARSAEGDSSTEPYLVGHHALLAHAAAVHIYNEKFKVTLILKNSLIDR